MRHNILHLPQGPNSLKSDLDWMLISVNHGSLIEQESLTLGFQSLKTKGCQPYFQPLLLQCYSNNQTHT